MHGDSFVYLIYEGKLAVASKEKWNARKGYVPDTYEATEESLGFLKTISPNFRKAAECFFSFKGSKKEAIKLLEAAGVMKVNFGQVV